MSGWWVLGTCWREDSDEVRQELGGGQAAGATSAVSCPCSWLLACPSPAQHTASSQAARVPVLGNMTPHASGVSCIKIPNFSPIIKIQLGMLIVEVKVLKVLNDGDDVTVVGGEAVAVLAAILLTPPL